MGCVTPVSVVIPTWNRSAVLAQAIHSVLSQTYPPLEVLVCDDGSTDDTEHVIASFKDPRVIWLPGEHSGRPAVPRNRGIRASKGEWIAFLDDDDTWLPEKLEKQLELSQRTGLHAVCSRAFSSEGYNSDNMYRLEWSGKSLSFQDLLQGNHVICSSVMIQKSVLSRVDAFPEAVELASIEDYALWLRVAVLTRFAFQDEALVIYADSPQTSIRSVNTDAWRQKQLVLGNFMAWGSRNGIGWMCMFQALRKYGGAIRVRAAKRIGSSMSYITGNGQ